MGEEYLKFLEEIYGGPRPLSPFYKNLYNAVNDPSLDSAISWSESNKSFIIWDLKEFESKVLALVSSYKDLRIFFIDLKEYGFQRVRGSHHLEFGHSDFKRGHPSRLAKMQKKTLIKNDLIDVERVRAAKKAEKAAEKAADGLHQLRI